MVESAMPSTEFQKKSWRLLCVDDDKHVLSALRRLFRQQPYQVLVAECGADGLQILEHEPVDMVISDMRMPEMNGAEFLEQVRMRWPDKIRVLLTGYADINATIDAINKGGISYYFTKPWDEQEVLPCILQALEQREQQEAERLRREDEIRRQNEVLQARNFELEAELEERRANLQNAQKAIRSLQDAREQSDYLAHHDPLTGLANRVLLSLRMEHAIKRAQRRHEMFAVLFIDLDRFKEVNDRLGHGIGDMVLQEVAHAMQALLRQEDTLARLGGDEFVVLVERIENKEAAYSVAEKLLSAFPRHISGPDQDIAVSASIGISCYPRDGDNVSKLIEAADAAMYQVKMAGRSSLCRQGILRPNVNKHC